MRMWCIAQCKNNSGRSHVTCATFTHAVRNVLVFVSFYCGKNYKRDLKLLIVDF